MRRKARKESLNSYVVHGLPGGNWDVREAREEGVATVKMGNDEGLPKSSSCVNRRKDKILKILGKKQQDLSTARVYGIRERDE